MKPNQARPGTPLPIPLQTKLLAVARKIGPVEAAKQFGISELAMLRAVVGAGVRRKTAEAIEARL